MRNTMSKIAILTDSSCDIPQELAEKYGIDIMGIGRASCRERV